MWIAHARRLCQRALKPLLIGAAIVLLTVAVLNYPEWILIFFTVQPLLIMLFVKYTVFSDDDSESSQHTIPNFNFFEAGQPTSNLWNHFRAWSASPRSGRGQKLKNGVVLAIFFTSLALLYICAIKPELLLLNLVLQPLLIFMAGKWIKDFDSVASLEHRVIRLERVAFDPTTFNDVDMPRSCAICLCDFDGTTEPTGNVRGSTSYSRNIVLLDGADAATCRPGEIVRLPCARAHCFHAACIHEWLTAYGTCPICRTRSGEELPRWWIVRQWCSQFSTSRPTRDSSLTLY
jgi:hypothetical protein